MIKRTNHSIRNSLRFHNFDYNNKTINGSAIFIYFFGNGSWDFIRMTETDIKRRIKTFPRTQINELQKGLDCYKNVGELKQIIVR